MWYHLTGMVRCLNNLSGQNGAGYLPDSNPDVKDKEVKLIAHFDGKFLKRDMDGMADGGEVMVNLASGPSLIREQFISASRLEEGTGYDIALQLYNQYLALEIIDNIFGILSDTCSVKLFFFCTHDDLFRLIKLVTERIMSVRSEEKLHNTLMTVKELRRLNDLFKRGKINNTHLKEVMRKYLDR